MASSGPVTVVGGGPATVPDLTEALALAPILVAADGGAGLALRAGVVPDAVIGDMDSLTAADRARLPPERVHPVADQDSTDFDKVLRAVRAPVVIGVGFLGGRIDHQLAAFSTLMAFAQQPCILLGETELVFHAPPSLALDVAAGDTVSLFPLAPVTGRSTGLEWPIDGLAFCPGQRIGTSNRALGPVTLEVDGPGLLVIAPRRMLAPLTRELSAAAPGWPARA